MGLGADGHCLHHLRFVDAPLPEEPVSSPCRQDVARISQRDREAPSPAPPDEADSRSYNVLQRVTYLLVIFILFPLVIWTGLAMSPGFNAAVPWAVNSLGGRQSARTLHFFVSIFLVLFLVVHVAMVMLTGFASRMREMITGLGAMPQERT